jgi:hypothetical protein
MKEKRIYKILRTEGIGIKAKSAHYISYLGKSRIDGYPLFEVEYDPNDLAHSVDILKDSLIVNTKPGYVLKFSEIQIIEPLEDNSKPIITWTPKGSQFYLDYVYVNKEFDERLLLMM